MRRWGGGFRGSGSRSRRGDGGVWTKKGFSGGGEGEKTLGGVVETDDGVLWVLV